MITPVFHCYLNMMKNYLILFIYILVLFVCVERAGWAGEPETTARQDSTGREKKFDAKKRYKDMNLFLDKIEIHGRIDKPQTVFIVQGKDPSVDDIHIDRSFFKEIFRRVEKDDIRKITRKITHISVNNRKK